MEDLQKVDEFLSTLNKKQIQYLAMKIEEVNSISSIYQKLQKYIMNDDFILFSSEIKEKKKKVISNLIQYEKDMIEINHLLKRDTPLMIVNTICDVITSGDDFAIDIIQWLIEQGFHYDSDKCIISAIENDYVELLQYFYSIGCSIKIDKMIEVILNKNQNAKEWFIEQGHYSKNQSNMEQKN